MEVLLTEHRAADTRVRQVFAEHQKKHGEAEHQLDLEGIAFSTIQRQSKANQVHYHDEWTGQDQWHKCVEGIEVQSNLWRGLAFVQGQASSSIKFVESAVTEFIHEFIHEFSS